MSWAAASRDLYQILSHTENQGFRNRVNIVHKYIRTPAWTYLHFMIEETSSPVWIKACVAQGDTRPAREARGWGDSQVGRPNSGHNLEGTPVRVRLTQSRLEMALSSVTSPSSYRSKQMGDTAESWETRVLLGLHSHLQAWCAGVQLNACACSRGQVLSAPRNLTPRAQ